jgi:hypothetical protein
MADQIVDEEEWRPIEGQPGYEVSSLGRVRSLERVIMRSNGRPHPWPGRVLKPGHTKIKTMIYQHVVLGKKRSFFVHALVCAAFHGPRPSLKHEVAHWDGDGWNCRSANLRWATHADNHADKVRHGRHMRGARHHGVKLMEHEVREIRAKLRDGQILSAIARIYSVKPGTISMIRDGRSWTWLD